MKCFTKMTVKIYITILFILLYFLFIFNVTGKKIKDFNCPCGVDRNTYKNDLSYKHQVKKVIHATQQREEDMKNIGSHDRIIGGKKPKFSVAWMAELSITTEDNLLMERRCGAVLINSKFLLTAGHCLCNPLFKLGCELKNGAWRPIYNITKYIRVNVNIRTLPNTNGGLKAQILVAKKGIIHRKFLKSMNVNQYEKNKDGPYDIALIELMKRVAVNKSQLKGVRMMPICMPSKAFKDTGVNATIAGYGLIGNREVECITDSTGPDVYTRCSRKHRKGQMEPGEHNEICQTNYTPSKRHNICRYFNNLTTKAMKMEEVILIPKNKQNDQDGNYKDLKGLPSAFSCFPTKAMHGWCKTCNHSADRNTPGFCDPNVFNDTNDKHVPITQFDSGWGFCSLDCHSSMRKSDTIITLHVYILTEAECNKMLKYYKEPRNIDTARQLCAGVKLTLFPVYYNYEKVSGKQSYKFSKIPSKKEPPNPKQKRLRNEDGLNLPFHIGGKDSCYGDSGSPIWTTFNDKEYLVGLVSSGTGCSEHNRPGIYCRVKPKLGWIYKWAKAGACNNKKRKKKKRKYKKNRTHNNRKKHKKKKKRRKKHKKKKKKHRRKKYTI